MDQQIEFTQNAVDSVAVLIERARVDMQAKNETGNEAEYKTKHIKIHHRARFVLQDSPKVLTNLGLVTMAMNGLNSVMVTLSSREGHDVHLQPSRGGVQRTRSPSGRGPPPAYAAGDFLTHRRDLNKSVQRKQVHQKVGFPVPDNQVTPPFFATRSVPHHQIHHCASMSSISPSINFSSTLTDEYYENAIADDTTFPPACLPTASIRDSIGSDEYFGPYEMDNTSITPSNTHEMNSTFTTPSNTYELDASTPRNVLHTYHTAPAVPTLARKPTGYQPTHYKQHRALNPSISSLPSTNSWASSTPEAHTPSQYPPDAQKNLPILPLNPTSSPSLHATISSVSLNSTPSSMGAPPISRGRSWLIDRATRTAAGNVSPISRTQSNASGLQNPYPYHGPDDVGRGSGGWMERR